MLVYQSFLLACEHTATLHIILHFHNKSKGIMLFTVYLRQVARLQVHFQTVAFENERNTLRLSKTTQQSSSLVNYTLLSLIGCYCS